MFKISSEFPIPSIVRGSRQSKYPLDTMLVGESFEIGNDEKLKANVNQAIFNLRKKGSSKKFTVRNTGTGYRCWRVE